VKQWIKPDTVFNLAEGSNAKKKPQIIAKYV